jgi:hypothetical protein
MLQPPTVLVPWTFLRTHHSAIYIAFKPKMQFASHSGLMDQPSNQVASVLQQRTQWAHPDGAGGLHVKFLGEVGNTHVGLLLDHGARVRLQRTRYNLQLRRFPRAVYA